MATTLIEVPGGMTRSPSSDSGLLPRGPDNFDEFSLVTKFYLRATDLSVPVGTVQSLRFYLAEGREATVHVRLVKGMPVADNVLLYHQSEREALGLADQPNPCKPQTHTDRLIARAAARHDRTPVIRAYPVVEQVSKSGNALDVSVVLAEWTDNDMVVDFEAQNTDFTPSQLATIEVANELGEPLETKLLYPNTEQGDGVLAVIAGHQSVAGSLLLPGAASRNASAMELRFRGMRGGLPYYTAIKVVRFRPITDAETERGMRDRQMAISVRALGGGYWMDTGDPAIQRATEGTPMVGLGVRVSKGMTHNFAFEGEVLAGRTGEAMFTAAEWGGMPGDITRSASLGRLHAMGVIRFGDRYVISTRLGVGLQLASYDSTFDAGANVMEGPGDGMEVDGVWTVGSGFDIRLNEHWNVGMGAMFAGTLYTGARSLDAGIQLGYSWGRSAEE